MITLWDLVSFIRTRVARVLFEYYSRGVGSPTTRRALSVGPFLAERSFIDSKCSRHNLID